MCASDWLHRYVGGQCQAMSLPKERKKQRSEELFSRQAYQQELQVFLVQKFGFSKLWLSYVHCIRSKYVSMWKRSPATLAIDPSYPYCSVTVLQSMKLGIDVNRHKEIIVKSISTLLLLLLKHFKLNHIYQVSS